MKVVYLICAVFLFVFAVHVFNVSVDHEYWAYAWYSAGLVLAGSIFTHCAFAPKPE